MENTTQPCQLASLLTGLMRGMIKYEDSMPEHMRQNMAHNLMWAHKIAKLEMSKATLDCVKEVLGQDAVEEYIASENRGLPF